MIKKLENMIEVYGSMGANYDYVNRVLASFAEIYNYDYTKSSLMEDGALYKEKGNVVRKNGVFGRIRGYYENHLHSQDIVKMYYNESVLDISEKTEFGFLSLGSFDAILKADMIALAVRILEAFGMNDCKVFLSFEQQEILAYLDALDIDYEEKEREFFSGNTNCFQVVKKQDNDEILLMEGGDFSLLAKDFSDLSTNVFGIWGFVENLIFYAQQFGNLHVNEKMLDVVVTYETEEELYRTLYLVQELRLNGFKTEFVKRCKKEYLKEHYNTKYVISMKEENMKKEEVLLTDLYTNEKKMIAELDLVDHLDINF